MLISKLVFITLILRGIPTEQGLKRKARRVWCAKVQILRGIPTEQGLKQLHVVVNIDVLPNSQRYSNRTRIETL